MVMFLRVKYNKREVILMDFNQIAIDERQKGTPSSETAEILYNANADASVGDVVFAFAVSGHPVFDNILGARTYFIRKMGFLDPELEGIMLEKLREVNYPEAEIQEALNRVVG